MRALPGDTFFFAGGDLHLKQPDGTWAIARKPEKIQEAVMQDIYEHGAQTGYVPWAATGSSRVEAAGEALTFTVQPGLPTDAVASAVHFTQPLRNVYLKPGKAYVTRLPAGAAGAVVEVSMTKPVFTVGNDQGNVWDLDSWEIRRLKTTDLDFEHGAKINGVMNEWVGDVRLIGTVRSIEGTVALHLTQGQAPMGHDYVLELTSTTWRVTGDGKELGNGSTTAIGKELRFGHLDGQIIVALDRQELLRTDVPDSDPSIMRVHLSLNGAGTLVLASPKLQRDLHYCARGILQTDPEGWKAAEIGKNSEDQLIADKSAENQRLMALVRTQMRGTTNLTAKQMVERWGVSPETAITVPADCYLLMGDNSPFSWDGRYWGYVPGENLRGRVFAVMFPPQRWKFVR